MLLPLTGKMGHFFELIESSERVGSGSVLISYRKTAFVDFEVAVPVCRKRVTAAAAVTTKMTE